MVGALVQVVSSALVDGQVVGDFAFLGEARARGGS